MELYFIDRVFAEDVVGGGLDEVPQIFDFIGGQVDESELADVLPCAIMIGQSQAHNSALKLPN